MAVPDGAFCSVLREAERANTLHHSLAKPFKTVVRVTKSVFFFQITASLLKDPVMKSPFAQRDQMIRLAPSGQARVGMGVMGQPVGQPIQAEDSTYPRAFGALSGVSTALPADTGDDNRFPPTPAQPYRSALVDALLDQLKEARMKRFPN
jgi:hypothetical protein